jgi:hypothetical protein
MTTQTIWTPGTQWRKQDIETQDTQPLLITLPFRAQKPSLMELRLACGLRREQVAHAAVVRLCRLYWMECGIETNLGDALKVVLVLSRAARYWYRVEDIRGLRIKAQHDDHPPVISHHKTTHEHHGGHCNNGR